MAGMQQQVLCNCHKFHPSKISKPAGLPLQCNAGREEKTDHPRTTKHQDAVISPSPYFYE
jgi:hypothetical protein